MAESADEASRLGQSEISVKIDGFEPAESTYTENTSLQGKRRSRDKQKAFLRLCGRYKVRARRGEIEETKTYKES